MPFEFPSETASANQFQPSPLHAEWFRTSAPERANRTDNARTGTDVPPATSDRPTTTPANRPDGAPANWTVAINLAANGTFSQDNLGADSQWRRLQELAGQTRGVPVDLVVQLTSGQANSKGGNRAPGEGAQVHRYLVSNGQIQEIDNGPSRGMAADVSDLLRAANRVAPSEHLALIQQSHGGGSDGVEGASGSATMPEFTEAIRAGLQGSNHQRLDLIDFNACSMATTSVVEQMGQVADHMVASSEVELGSPDGAYDGQNIRHTISQLLANPNVSAADLARNMIVQADQGHNDGFNGVRNEQGSGTPTLAHFDLQQLPVFNQKLNSFGEALAASMSANPANMEAIDRAIEGATVLPREGIHMGGAPLESRDLTNFANNIIQEIDSGKLVDANGQLRESARSMLAAQRQLEPQYHGSQSGGYDRLGGLNAFLPDLELRDPSLEASPNINPIAQTLMQTEHDNSFATMQHRDIIVNNISRELSNIERLAGPSHADDVRTLNQSLQSVSAASDDQQLRQALDAMNAQLQRMQDGQLGRDVSAGARREVRERYFRDEALAGLPGWQSFMEALRIAKP